MKRLPDWEARLSAYLDSVRYEPFAYGRHDCALHSANAVMAMTGEDFAAEFRGRYRSAAGSIRVLRQYGAGDLVSTITAKFGEPIPTAFAQRGDLVMTEGSVGVCMGGLPSRFSSGCNIGASSPRHSALGLGRRRSATSSA